jgi:hypothetical protein
MKDPIVWSAVSLQKKVTWLYFLYDTIVYFYLPFVVCTILFFSSCKITLFSFPQHNMARALYRFTYQRWPQVDRLFKCSLSEDKVFGCRLPYQCVWDCDSQRSFGYEMQLHLPVQQEQLPTCWVRGILRTLKNVGVKYFRLLFWFMQITVLSVFNTRLEFYC